MRKMMINIDVPSLNAGIEFYSHGLGFALKRTLFQRTVAEMTLGDTIVYLVQKDEGSKPVTGADITRTFGRHWTPVHIDVVVDHLNTAVATALEAGAMLSGDATDHAWGKLASLSDPFGHGICLLEFSVEGYDIVADE